jgi:addiction module HigA family antidote
MRDNQTSNSDERIPVPSVGEILQEEFLEPLDITPYRLAKDIHVATSTVLDIVHGRRRITVDMSLRFARYFGTSERFWLNLQNAIDIRNRKGELAADLQSIHPVERSA